MQIRTRVGDVLKRALTKLSKIHAIQIIQMLIIESFSQGNDVNFTSITLSVVDKLAAQFEGMKG